MRTEGTFFFFFNLLQVAVLSVILNGTSNISSYCHSGEKELKVKSLNAEPRGRKTASRFISYLI